MNPRSQHLSPQRAWAALVLVTLLSLFLRLGTPLLIDVDEGAFSEATREMVVSGDWGRTMLNGEPRFDKPILVYWLQAVAVKLLGPEPLAFRLPSALCATLWVGSIVVFARRRLGERSAWGAGMVAVTSAGVLSIGRTATADALLNALICLCMLDLWRFLEPAAAGSVVALRASRACLWRAYAWMGLGLLAKGPVALLIPMGATLLYAALSGRWTRLRQAAGFWPGWLLGLTIALPWYGYALATQGQAFVQGFLIKHNVGRYAGTLEGHSGNALYYLVVAPLMWLPWTSALPGVFRQWRASWSDELGKFLWAWLIFVIFFFTLSGTKLPHYVLYGSTPMFMFLANALNPEPQRWSAKPTAVPPWDARWSWLLPLIMVAVVGTAPALIGHFAADTHDALYRALLAPATLPAAPTLAWLPGLAAVAALLLWRGLRDSDLRFAAAASLWALALAWSFMPWLGEVLQGPVRDAAVLAKARPEVAVQWDVHLPSFSVYREQVTERREPRPGELALVRMDKLAAQPCADCQVLLAERGMALIRRTPKPAVGSPP